MKQHVYGLALFGSMLAIWPLACGSDTESTFGSGTNRDGGATDDAPEFGAIDGASSSDGSSGPGTGVLEATVRDFKRYASGDATTNPDFENVPPPEDRPAGTPPSYAGDWTEASAKYFPGAQYTLDIVAPDLGTDGKPVYNPDANFRGTQGRTATTHGKAPFDQWYRDVDGINLARKVPIKLSKGDSGVYSYDSAVSGVPLSGTDSKKQFFPIDDGTALATPPPFGNQGLAHNYHFTVELHTKFKYKGSETFKFSGDDDVFVFINKKLVINIGGIHSALSHEVNLPGVASEIGLVVGQEYPLDFFQAERHVTGSNLRIDTTLELQPAIIR